MGTVDTRPGQGRHANAALQPARLVRHPQRVERVRARRLSVAGRLGRRGALTVGGGAVFVLGAGVALAYVTGEGSSTSATATVRPGVLTAAPVTATGLYPGATTTANVRISNPGPYPMAVTTLSGGAAPAVTTTTGTCPAGSVVVGGGPTTLPTIAPSATATVAVPVTMATDASSNCQGARVTVPVTVRGTNR